MCATTYLAAIRFYQLRLHIVKQKTAEMDRPSAHISSAVNLTSQFNELLVKHSAPPVVNKVSLDDIDSFLKEAYRIVRLLGQLYILFEESILTLL